MRMRTQSEVMAYIREQDPDTALTPWALRSMVLTGTIPSVQVGKKRLIDLDTLDVHLSSSQVSESDASEGYGMIRPIGL